MYSSPSNLISAGKYFLCARRRRRYRGIGGRRAIGAGRMPRFVPMRDGDAKRSRDVVRMVSDYMVNRLVGTCMRQGVR